MLGAASRKEDDVDVTGTLRKAQRQIEGQRAKTGLRLLRALEPEELKLPERLRFYYLRALAQLQRQEAIRALIDLDKAATLAQQLHNGELSARIANLIGWAHAQQNRPAMALEFHERAGQAIDLGIVSDAAFAAIVQGNQGQAYLALGNYERAGAAFQAALERGAAQLAPMQAAVIGWGLARAALHAGQAQQARVHALRALGYYERGKYPSLLAPLRLDYAVILHRLGNHDEAERQLQQALVETEGDSRIQIFIRIALADLALERDDPASAEREAEAALTRASSLKDSALLGSIWYRIALSISKSNAEAGREAYRQATRALGSADPHGLLPQVLWDYAHILNEQGELTGAAAVFEDAYHGRSDVATPQSFDFALPLLDGFTRTPATNGERRRGRSGASSALEVPAAMVQQAQRPQITDGILAASFIASAQE